MHIKVLHLLVVIGVRTGFSASVQILDYRNAVLKDRFSEVDGDYHDVSERTELYICCLVTRLIGCAGSSRVDKRPEVVSTSAAARVRY